LLVAVDWAGELLSDDFDLRLPRRIIQGSGRGTGDPKPGE
jgi:hypothetical protein